MQPSRGKESCSDGRDGNRCERKEITRVVEWREERDAVPAIRKAVEDTVRCSGEKQEEPHAPTTHLWLGQQEAEHEEQRERSSEQY